MEFQIDIKEKVARVIGTPVIVCGNSDYTIRFTFDAEWLDKVAKTARFVWVKNGETQYEEVVFTGSTVAVPTLSNITAVQVGVYAGELQTTTPARVPCVRSILCGGGEHTEPPADVYAQLLELIEDSAMQTPVTLAIEERNTGAPFTIWVGTVSQFNAIPQEDIVEDCIYWITDDDTPVHAADYAALAALAETSMATLVGSDAGSSIQGPSVVIPSAGLYMCIMQGLAASAMALVSLTGDTDEGFTLEYSTENGFTVEGSNLTYDSTSTSMTVRRLLLY